MGETANPLPSSGSAFFARLVEFLRDEDADRYNEMFESFVVDGGIGATAASLTHTPAPLIAYVAGYRTTESGAITYSNNATTWVIAAPTTSGNLTSDVTWTRVSGTHYLINATASERPDLPTGAIWLMVVTTSGGAITAVQDLRRRQPITLPWLDITQAPFSAVGDGVTDNTKAIDAALAAGAYIIFPPGVYRTTGGHLAPSTLTLVGYGATIEYSGGPFLTATDTEGLEVSGFTFSPTSGSFMGIVVEGTSGSNIRIHHNIFNGGAPSIYLRTGELDPILEYANISDNIWNGTGSGAFFGAEGVRTLIVARNQGRSGSEFIDINNGNVDVTVTGNIAYEFSDNVLDINYVRRAVVTDNVIGSETTTCKRPLQVTSNSDGSTPIVSSDQTIIANNVITAKFSEFGLIYQCVAVEADELNKAVLIQGNVLTQLPSSVGGLCFISTNSWVTVIGNSFKDGGLQFFGTERQFVCASNTFSGSTVSLRIDEANGGTIVGNIFAECAASGTSDGVIFPAVNASNINILGNTFIDCTGTFFIRCHATSSNIKSHGNLGTASKFASGGVSSNVQIDIPDQAMGTFLATPSSANLRAALTDETGTGAAVFATSPTIITPSVAAPVITGATTYLEGGATPTTPADGTECNVYMRTDKLIIQYNDGGTTRYKYLDLTGTGVTWVHTTSAP